MSKKIVLFGAGRIGRSFIGQLFCSAGYEIVFVDTNRRLVDLLNHHRQYRVVIKSDAGERTIWVRNVRAVHFDNSAAVTRELAEAGIASVSVGQQGLAALKPLFAGALLLRRKKYGDRPLDVILAENMRNADNYFRRMAEESLPGEFPVGELLGLVETSIGKMVPIMTRADMEEDPLRVFAEPYCELIVSGPAFKNGIPEVENLVPKDNIKAWVDRKLFIHNLGHTTAAWLGFRADNRLVYMHEALALPEVLEASRQAMRQSAGILTALYPADFSDADIGLHIDDLLYRFGNRSLGDTLFRVGCDLYRKLGPDDRFTSPLEAATRMGKPYDLILKAMIAGISFRATDEEGNYFPADEKFFQEAEKGVRHVLTAISGLSADIAGEVARGTLP
jgi:mannitol-1-phosphate 5-dehydrogenase